MPYFKTDRWKKIIHFAEQWREEAGNYINDPAMFPTRKLGYITQQLIQLCDSEGLHIDTAPLIDLSCQIDVQQGKSSLGRVVSQKNLLERMTRCVWILDRLFFMGSVKDNPADSIPLGERELLVLQVLHQEKVFGSDHRMTTEKIAIKAIGNTADQNNFKEVIVTLKKLGYISTKEGRSGGCWLTDKGKERANKL
jgi:hypothetical protein